MKLDISQMAQKTLLSICILGLPVNCCNAYEETNYPRNSYSTYNYNNDGYATCESSQNDCCCYNNKIIAIGAGAAVLGAVAGVLVSKGYCNRHSHSSGGGRAHRNHVSNVVIQRDIGQTIDITAEFSIQGLEGTTTVTLWAVGADEIPIKGESQTHTAAGGIVNIPVILKIPTINDPIIGTYTIFVDISLNSNVNNGIEVSEINYIVNSSRGQSPTFLSTFPADYVLPLAVDNIDAFREQASVSYLYSGQ